MAGTFNYQFEWDPEKASTNSKKHGLSFGVAATVFSDPLAVSIPDEDHSDDEERWLTLGQAENGKLVVVAHTFVEHAGSELAKVRIISARFATKHEIRQYETGT